MFPSREPQCCDPARCHPLSSMTGISLQMTRRKRRAERVEEGERGAERGNFFLSHMLLKAQADWLTAGEFPGKSSSYLLKGLSLAIGGALPKAGSLIPSPLAPTTLDSAWAHVDIKLIQLGIWKNKPAMLPEAPVTIPKWKSSYYPHQGFIMAQKKKWTKNNILVDCIGTHIFYLSSV